MTDDALAQLRDALVNGLRAELPEVDPGYAAFERHQLLAIRFHRAARLNDPNEPEQGERRAWEQYFREHFPRGDEHAVRLFEYWRNPMVKDEYPGRKILVSHGQPHAHWSLDVHDRLFIDLESMCSDFEQSVVSLVEMLATDPARRRTTIERFNQRQWRVERIELQEPKVKGVTTTASSSQFFTTIASATAASAWGPPQEKHD